MSAKSAADLIADGLSGGLHSQHKAIARAFRALMDEVAELDKALEERVPGTHVERLVWGSLLYSLKLMERLVEMQILAHGG